MQANGSSERIAEAMERQTVALDRIANILERWVSDRAVQASAPMTGPSSIPPAGPIGYQQPPGDAHATVASGARSGRCQSCGKEVGLRRDGKPWQFCFPCNSKKFSRRLHD